MKQLELVQVVLKNALQQTKTEECGWSQYDEQDTTFEQDFGDSHTFTYLELQTRNIYALNLDLEMNLDTLVDTLDTHTQTHTHEENLDGRT